MKTIFTFCLKFFIDKILGISLNFLIVMTLLQSVYLIFSLSEIESFLNTQLQQLYLMSMLHNIPNFH